MVGRKNIWQGTYFARTDLVRNFGCPYTAWSKRVWSRFLVGHIRLGQNAFGLDFLLAICGLVKTRLVWNFNWPYHIWSKRIWSGFLMDHVISGQNRLGLDFFFKCFLSKSLFVQLCSVQNGCDQKCFWQNTIQAKCFSTNQYSEPLSTDQPFTDWVCFLPDAISTNFW